MASENLAQLATGRHPSVGVPYTGFPEAELRREPRVGFELPVRIRHGVTRSTVMLKDMTAHGARIEGIGPLELDELLTLHLPDLAPCSAYVAWSSGCAVGLEFDRPLPPAEFARLVADYAIHRQDAAA